MKIIKNVLNKIKIKIFYPLIFNPFRKMPSTIDMLKGEDRQVPICLDRELTKKRLESLSKYKFSPVAKLANAPDLGSGELNTLAGSTPVRAIDDFYTRKCLICDCIVKNEFNDNDDNAKSKYLDIPHSATCWRTSGNYGSTVIDDFTHTFGIEIIICD